MKVEPYAVSVIPIGIELLKAIASSRKKSRQAQPKSGQA